MKLSIVRKLASMMMALAFTSLLISCGPTVKVTTDYDRAANFQQYKTFGIYKLDGKTDAISELNANRITNAVKAEMIKKGFQESATPDLLVNPVAILKDRKSLSSNTDYYGYGGGYRPYGMWGGGVGGVSGTTTYNVQDYKDGSLIIDIVDAASKKLVWQGTGNSEIDKPLKDPDTQIPAAVTKIMASFPVGAATK